MIRSVYRSSSAPTVDLPMPLLPNHMCTYIMHILVCMLKNQELARDCTGDDGEGWAERGMGRSKSDVKYCTTVQPGKLLLHDTMVDDHEALVHMW